MGIVSRCQTGDIFLIFPHWDNFHETSKPIFLGGVGGGVNISKCNLLKFLPSMLSVKH